MPVPRVRVKSQIKCGDVHNSKLEKTVLSNTGEKTKLAIDDCFAELCVEDIK